MTQIPKIFTDILLHDTDHLTDCPSPQQYIGQISTAALEETKKALGDPATWPERVDPNKGTPNQRVHLWTGEDIWHCDEEHQHWDYIDVLPKILINELKAMNLPAPYWVQKKSLGPGGWLLPHVDSELSEKYTNRYREGRPFPHDPWLIYVWLDWPDESYYRWTGYQTVPGKPGDVYLNQPNTHTHFVCNLSDQWRSILWMATYGLTDKSLSK